MSMNKKKMIIVWVLMILGYFHPCYSEDKPPALYDCDCKSWKNYELDYIAWYDRQLREAGVPALSIKEVDKQKINSKQEKSAFLAGLMNAYALVEIDINNIIKNSSNEELKKKASVYHLPYMLGTYRMEIDNFCSKPENENVPIAGAILLVNLQLKMR